MFRLHNSYYVLFTYVLENTGVRPDFQDFKTYFIAALQKILYSLTQHKSQSV